MHFTEQTDQPWPTVFRKRWASCNNGMSVILRKFRKGGETGGRRHCGKSSFNSILVCLFIFLSFFLSLFVCMFVRFLSLLHLREQL